jgi:hypothetical protein
MMGRGKRLPRRGHTLRELSPANGLKGQRGEEIHDTAQNARKCVIPSL